MTYNPETDDLRGWRLMAGHYEPIKPNEQGWLWCSELGLWLGVVEHQFLKYDHPVKVLRFFDEAGHPIPTAEEAEAQAQARRAAEQRAEAEIEARQAAEVEIARLRALLAQKECEDD